MAELQRNFHVLHRSGYVGTGVPREKPMMNTEQLLPPATNAGADCPAGGQCDICPISGRCTRLRELQTYADEHEMLLPAFLNVNSNPRAAASDDEMLLPLGVE